jgi:hypothetical protein
MPRVVEEISVQRVEKIDGAQRKTTTDSASERGAVGAQARLSVIKL